MYEFKLREVLKFHNGDPFTAEDVKFSFERAKGAKALQARVREVTVVDRYRVRFQLGDPWPDFMTFYGTLATSAACIAPKGVCVCINAVYGNAASRLAQTVPGNGAFAYGSYPDVEALYRQQAGELDRKKRAELLRQLQTLLHERVRFAPIYDYIWPSGIGPRVEEPALMLIDPYPWSAPLEEVRLKKR